MKEIENLDLTHLCTNFVLVFGRYPLLTFHIYVFRLTWCFQISIFWGGPLI